MNNEYIKKIIIDQRGSFLNKNKFFDREKEKKISDFLKLKEVLVITGLRRTGKSALLKLIWDEISKKDKAKNNFLYLNFEDERFVGFDYKDFDLILDSFFELYGEKTKNIYLFFDEIQNIKYWEKWISRLYETGKYKIFITGSNATLLSSELATSLTGRNIRILLFPLSFFEYLNYFKKNNFSKVDLYNKEKERKIKKVWKEFLERGGMPEIAKTNSTELIQEYFKNILFRDIVLRHNIKHKKELQELSHLLLANLGQYFSLQKIGNGIGMKNVTTVKNYLKFLEDSFMFFSVPMFSFSYKQQIYNPDKYYVIDHGFFNKIAFKFSENSGNILENIVAVELKRRKKEIYYFKSKKNLEIDFVVKEKGSKKIESLVQVSWSLINKNTKERELNSLLEGMKELKIGIGYILTNDEEDEIKIDGLKIIVLPVRKWLLMDRV